MVKARPAAFSRVNSSNNPLQIFLALNEIDRRPAGAQPLSPDTIRALAAQFPRFHDQYETLTEFRALNDASISRFLNVAASADRMPDRMLRADALGILQANIELWRIRPPGADSRDQVERFLAERHCALCREYPPRPTLRRIIRRRPVARGFRRVKPFSGRIDRLASQPEPSHCRPASSPTNRR